MGKVLTGGWGWRVRGLADDDILQQWRPGCCHILKIKKNINIIFYSIFSSYITFLFLKVFLSFSPKSRNINK